MTGFRMDPPTRSFHRNPFRQAGCFTKLTKGTKKDVESKISCFFVRFVVIR